MTDVIKCETLLQALFYCKNEIPEIEKTKTAKVRMKSGGEYSYKYADLAVVQRAIKEPLTKYGLVIHHEIIKTDKGETLTTFLDHLASKETLKSTIEIQPGQLQEKGADITYAKRYNIGALLDLLLDEDVDAPQRQENKVTQGSSQPPKTQPPKQENKSAGIPANPGDYVIKFGKFQSKKINQVDIDAHWEYIGWLEKESERLQKPLTANAKEYITAVEACSAPGFDPNEQLP